MEADWQVEIGGGAPVIDALWPGFVDLRKDPERIVEIAEAVDFAPLVALLLALNSAESPVWTSKCDGWEPEPGGQAVYIDMLPRDGGVFPEWKQAEGFCRDMVDRLGVMKLQECGLECSVELVVREAVAGDAEGFGVTAYLSAKGRDGAETAKAVGALMAGFADALRPLRPAETAGSKLQ